MTKQKEIDFDWMCPVLYRDISNHTSMSLGDVSIYHKIQALLT